MTQNGIRFGLFLEKYTEICPKQGPKMTQNEQTSTKMNQNEAKITKIKRPYFYHSQLRFSRYRGAPHHHPGKWGGTQSLGPIRQLQKIPFLDENFL